MKKIIMLFVCALAIPIASAQTKSNKNEQIPTVSEQITVTGTFIATEQGQAADYQPANTLVVRTDGEMGPGRYVLEGPARILDTSGRIIHTPIKPGAHVRVVYVDMDGKRMVDHVIVED